MADALRHNQMAGSATTKKTVSHVLGEVVWLLTQSPPHKKLFLGDLEWFVMPALLLEQYRVFVGADRPIGFALWARVSEDTDKRLRQPGMQKLRADEWNSGEIPWLIELVAPFGGVDEILTDFSSAIFPGEAFHYTRVSEEGVQEVATYEPAKIN